MAVTVSSAPPPVKRATTVTQQKAAAVSSARAEALAGIGPLIQLPLIITKQHADAGAVGLHWPNVSSEIAKLADTVPAIAKIVDPLLQAGPYAGLIAAVLPFALQIGVNHGFVRSGAMGTVPGSVLSAQVEASIAKTELEALRVQKEAEAEARRIREEIASARTVVEAA